ncbi:hypothetical protein CK203_108310 [Vitis vinifera]|uniref:Uncharacterized protein n=1 Tax=Vitis vinifera TaxID=29760 RepID=A0A438C550_VITVI|nr:hypothetical protein CK203_101119 [Vitis vinifera]RVW20779.1 hypothetical protein CK203_108310 [Vitis vinifera]
MTTHHVQDPTVIHFTIDGRHGILGARHIAKALRIPYETGTSTSSFLLRKELLPNIFILDTLLHHNIFPLQHMVQRKGAILEALECPQEEATESRYDSTAIPEPEAPTGPEHLEIPQPEEPQYAEIPIEIIAPAPAVPSIVLTPEATSSAPLTTPRTPPVVPATSASHPSESTIAMSISDFRGLCHTLQTLTTTLERPCPADEPTDPSQDTLLVEQTVPTEERTTGEIEAPIPSTKTSTAKPSSPHDPPTTI